MKFRDKLENTQNKNNSLLCVGLDSNYNRIPDFLKEGEYPIFEFNKRIIEATHDLVCAYKPNTAFYEGQGLRGIEQFKMTTDYLSRNYPEIPIIIDAKRGDIGNTNEGYINYVFGYLSGDAVTLHPYMGKESVQPFLDIKNKAIIFLVKTSNSGSDEFQSLELNQNIPLYLRIARTINDKWNDNGNCGMVVGATYPDEIKKVREVAPAVVFLVPGIGTQGGDVEKTVRFGKDNDGKGLIINSSRSIIFAGDDKDFDQKARNSAQNLREEINKYR
jgi:orotidine-5'-phosphate decarboxylase